MLGGLIGKAVTLGTGLIPGVGPFLSMGIGFAKDVITPLFDIKVLPGLALVAMLSFCVGSSNGKKSEREKCDAAAFKAKLAAAALDKKASDEQLEQAAKDETDLRNQLEKARDDTKRYEEQLAAVGARPGCILDADDVKRLR